MKWRTLLLVPMAVAGAILSAAAIWAPRLGLDSNDDWGPSRKLLLGAGAGLMVVAWAGLFAPQLNARWQTARRAVIQLGHRGVQASGLGAGMDRLGTRWSTSRLARTLGRLDDGATERWTALLARSRFLSIFLGTRRARVLTASWSAFVIVAVTYLWFVSVGMWLRWPGTSAYYDMQAEAFLAGQTHLVEEPHPELLALPDPYDPEARASVPHLWDASLYGGHYYLYWGPVPALLITPLKTMPQVRVGDDVFVFLFSVGSLFWVTRLITRLWAGRFPEIPGWVVVGSIVTVGWATPTAWLLNGPWIYEAAVVGGQFFLLMGINALYPLLAEGRGRPADLVWAGSSFALAVGTRSGIAAAAGVATAIVFVRLWSLRGAMTGIRTAGLMAAFVIPLALGALCLSLYNQIRFDSPFEFGHRYQLTSLDLSGDLESSGIGNIPPNLYNYLVNPVRVLRVFPYIKAYWGGVGMSALRIPVPPGYYSRQIAGLVIVAPFLLFALNAFSGLWKGWRRFDSVQGERFAADRVPWLTGALLAVGATQWLLILSYIVASMRYQGDFVPILMLVAVIGLWGALAERLRHGRSIAGYSLAALVFMAWTAIAGLLLGVTSYHARFEKLNPELFKWLTDALTL